MNNELKSRVELWLSTLKCSLYKPVQEISFVFLEVENSWIDGKGLIFPEGKITKEQTQKLGFRPIQPGDVWGKEWSYGWFFSEIHLGDWAAGKRVVMDLNLGGEATVFVNGEVFGTRRDDWIWEPHHFICDNYLTTCASGGEVFDLTAECYGGHEKPDCAGEAATGPYVEKKRWKRPVSENGRRVCGTSTVGIWREELYHLYLEAQALYDIWRNSDPDSLQAAELEEALKKFVLSFDFELDEEEMELSAIHTRKLLRKYLNCKNGSTTPYFHMIGHAHIDLAWLWPLEETKRKCARTMAAQIRHMDEYPEYKMIISQPFLLELIENYYPGLYRKMEEKIQDGQLIPEGGMWVESDTNLPSGESLIRQFLYGKSYFKEKFGIDSQILWLPDVFGYSASLPQIMQGCGIQYFTTHKIFWTYNGGEPFPYHYFYWKGLDGTRIPSFIHVEYSSATDADTIIKRWKNRAQKNGLKRFLQPFGYGDGGGGASRDHIENCRLFADMEGVPKMVFDDPAHFFRCIASDGTYENEYVGELYYQAHRGTYTSQARTKRGNRKAEFALRETEFWNSIAWLNGKTYPKTELECIWKSLLLNQFHDILPGSSIHKVYEKAEKELKKVCEDCYRLLDAAIAEPNGKKEKITLFNSLSWEREALIQLPEGWSAAIAEGQYLPIQKTKNGSSTVVRIPACGQISLTREEKKVVQENGAYKDDVQEVQAVRAEVFSDGGACMENRRMRVIFNSRGEIEKITDKMTGKDWAAGICNELCLYQDIPGHFEAWDIDRLAFEKKQVLTDTAVISKAAEGHLFAALRIERRINCSTLVQWAILKENETMISFRTKVNWQETHKLLKVVFRPRVETQELISEIQYGYVRRPNHDSRSYDQDRYEVCEHKWSALAETGKGFAILNDSKYGISCRKNCMELSLLKSSTFPDEAAEQGEQDFTYAFYFWNSAFEKSGLIQKGYELNTAPVLASGEQSTFSWIEVENDNIILDTLKVSEDGEGIILRFYESVGSETKAEIRLSEQMQSRLNGKAYLTSMTEDKKKKIVIDNGRLFLDFAPFQVQTIKLV